MAATATGYASAVEIAKSNTSEVELPLELSDNPGTLSGVVTDPQGRPVRDAVVFLPGCYGHEPLPGIRSSVTDAQGRYAITDLKRWSPEETKTFNPITKMGFMTTSCAFVVTHPDYPRTEASNSAVPQTVNVTLKPAAIVEGRVIDTVTQNAKANVVVSAQGIVKHAWYQTQTDRDGRYRLSMTKDHYNIWAEANDRMPLAVKALAAKPGQTISNADIRLVQGGFVVGTVFDAATNKPVSSSVKDPIRVAHYGPARPRTGAAVTSTEVNADGTYRLRVAPGRNFVYLMSAGHASAYVDVQDGRETKLDLRMDISGPRWNNAPEVDPDTELAADLREKWAAEEATVGTSSAGSTGNPIANLSQRNRRDTPTGRLLDELDKHNRRNRAFTDLWCRTLKAIVDIGPVAIPELIEELDASDDGRMLSCLGFIIASNW